MMDEIEKIKITGDHPNECYLCGAVGPTEVHHCMHGVANRKIADKYGLTVHLCHNCHMNLHDRSPILDKFLQRIAQINFEKKYTREEWMKAFRKNYL